MAVRSLTNGESVAVWNGILGPRRENGRTVQRPIFFSARSAKQGANPTENGNSNATGQPRPRRLTLPHTDGHRLRDYRRRNPTQGGPGRIPVHMTGSFAEPDCTALHCTSLPLAQRPKKGTKPKRTQRPKRARSRKGWPNSKKGRQRSQRPQTDQSTIHYLGVNGALHSLYSAKFCLINSI